MDILETLVKVLGPVLDGTNHGLGMDVVKLGGEVPRQLNVIDFKLQVWRDSIRVSNGIIF